MLANTKTLEDAKAVKAYLHPTRMKILGSVARNPKTISAVAREFGEHPANLTHHFRRLLSAGLIRLVEERSIGRNIEKFYLATALTSEYRPGAVVGHFGAENPPPAMRNQEILA